MAFTGTAVVTQITDRKVRITGLSLAGDATGTIGLNGDSGAGVQLPDSFNPKPTTYNGNPVSLADAIEVTQQPVTDVTTPVPISVTKGGTPFRITMHNDTAATAGPEIEIYVEYLDG